MPKDTKTLGNSKARACESLGFVHKKGCARVLTQPLFYVRKVKSSVSALILNRFSIYDANLLINSIFQFRQIL